jgi:hypothetical protein
MALSKWRVEKIWCLFGVYYERAPERISRIRETKEKFNSGQKTSRIRIFCKFPSNLMILIVNELVSPFGIPTLRVVVSTLSGNSGPDSGTAIVPPRAFEVQLRIL